MHKKTLIPITLLATFLFFVSTVSATDTTNPDTHSDQPRQLIRQMNQDERQENRQERIEHRQEVRSDIAENHANRLSRRFAFYYKRLTGIAARLDTRLTKLKTEGQDVSLALAKLAEARTKLESAKNSADQAVLAFQAIDPTKFSEQKAKALAARDLANSARTAFKDALVLLKNVLKEVK